MAAPIVCPKCGFTNQPGWTFCSNCGSPLAASGAPPTAAPSMPPTAPPAYVPPPAPYAGAPGYPPYGYGAPPWEADRQRQIGRTRTGVLLLLVGALLSWIPIIGALGGLLTLIGAILVILGRRAFGDAHRRNVIISIVLFFVGIVVVVGAVVVGVFAAFSAVSSSPNEAQLTSALRDAFTDILVIAAVGSFIFGLAGVFFTYALQKREGRILLWAAYGATIGIQIAIIVVVLPALQAVAASIAHEIAVSGTVNSTEISSAVTNAEGSLPLLSVVPSLIYAAANYLAYARINKGEIPPPPTLPAVPTFGPPAPPINPM